MTVIVKRISASILLVGNPLADHILIVRITTSLKILIITKIQ